VKSEGSNQSRVKRQSRVEINSVETEEDAGQKSLMEVYVLQDCEATKCNSAW
jgi:hypothetical protein